MPFLRFLALAGLLLLVSPARAAPEEPVDLELVIAVDVSWSVDAVEARLQREGYVRAFSDSQVIEAVQSGFIGKIAVLYFEWAGMGHEKILEDWTIIKDAADAKAFAAKLRNRPYESGYRTSISEAIDFAVPRFEANGFDGKRRVVDISGDGANNYGRLVTVARDEALAAGITINGLPIVSSYVEGDRSWEPNLDLYYENCVIGGRGAFLVVANGFADFANAVRQKLVLEIAGRTLDESAVRHAGVIPRPGYLGLTGAAPEQGFVRVQERGLERAIPPCDIGERRWMYRYGGYGN